MRLKMMGKPSSAGLFLLFLLFLGTTRTCWGTGNLTLSCFQVERRALLKFKEYSFDGSFHPLSSWEGNDCCSWYGVGCDEATGHVIKLDLRCEVTISGNLSEGFLVGNSIHSSLLDLKYLQYLDLSGNDFQESSIPKFFGSMKQLRYLNLSTAGFSGPVPPQLGNLSNLHVLDIAWGSMLTANNLEWVSRLSSLQILDMSYVDLSRVRHLMKTVSMIPSLLELRMSGCRLDNTHLSHADYFNSTILSNVQHLDLSGNKFKGKFPDFLQHNLTSLRILDLSSNRFNSSVPLFFHKSLVEINLAWNDFSHIEGSGNSSAGSCVSCNLKKLDLSGNLISGSLTEVFEVSSSVVLEELHLSYNQLKGPIPASLGRLTALRSLDLSYNKMNGTITKSLGQLSKLKIVDLSSNSLEGIVSEAHFANCSMLKDLNLGSNFMLTLDMQPGWIPPFQLNTIRMGSCKLGPLFPPWLQTQHSVYTLDLSNASISGTLPFWLHDMYICEIDLSHNRITGSLSILFNSLKVVHHPCNFVSEVATKYYYRSWLLNDNLFSGSIPKTVCNISSELQVLDLSRNRLQGDVPNCWTDLKHLTVLKLSSNMLSGRIPSSFGQLTSLQWLHLNNNSFHGKLTLDLRNCTNLVVLDVGENRLSGNIPKWIGGNLTIFSVLRLHENMFNGRIPFELCQLFALHILDLAGNSLTGDIPPCLGNLSGMAIQAGSINARDVEWDEENMVQVMKGVALEYTRTLVYVVNLDLSSNKLTGEIPEELTALSGLIGLNLSRNHLAGGIPDRIGSLKSLISLDFSWNNLSGVIPASMAALTSLSQLNLSFNNFSGRIPTGNQLQTLTDPSIYAGNNQLCGAPVPNKCPGDQVPIPTTGGLMNKEEDDEDDGSEKVWLYSGLLSGFATGFWGVIGVLALKTSWRRALFQFAKDNKDRVFVAIAIRVGKLKRGKL